MPINANPIVLKDTNGNLKEASQTNLEYMAFQAGLRISSDVGSTQPYAINTDATVKDAVIGSFVDTFYNEPVGTHPASSLTLGSTTTFLYQREDDQIQTDALAAFRRPVTDSDSGSSIIDMNDPSMTTLARELMGILQTEEYPGAYRLASTAPSADWTASLSNVFSDTNTNGTVTSYTVWQRTSGTMPDSCSPMYVRRDAYGTVPLGDYNGGLQAMTQEQTSVTFGQIIRKYFSDGQVGTYQLRSSAQGAPTDDGTWVARGTAVDTRFATESVQYSGQYTGYSNVNYSGSRDYNGNFVSTPTLFAGVRAFSGTRTYAGQYASAPIQFTGDRNFSGSRVIPGQFTSNPTAFAGVRSFSGSRTYVQSAYVSAPAQYAGVRYFSGPRNFSNNYTSAPAPFGGTRQFSGQRNFANNYTSAPAQFGGVRYFSGPRPFGNQYTGGPQTFGGVRYFAGPRTYYRPGVLYQNFAGSRATSYARPTAYYRPGVLYQNFVGTRQFAGFMVNFRPGSVTQTFVGPRQFNGPMPAQFAGPRPATFGGGVVPGTFGRPIPLNFLGYSASQFTVTYYIVPNPMIPGNVIVVPYSGVRTGQYSGVRTAYFSGSRPGSYSGVRMWQFSGFRTWQFSGPRAFAGPRVVQGLYTLYYPAQFTSNPANFAGSRAAQYLGYTTNYRPGVLYQQFGGSRSTSYAGVVNQPFGRPQNFTGTRQYSGARSATQPFGSPGTFTGTRTFSGSRAKGQQFSRPQNFTGTRNFSGSRPATQPFGSPGQFTGARNFSGQRVYSGNYSSPANFTGTRQFSGTRTFATDYVATGQFAGPVQYSGSRTYADQYDEPSQFTGTRTFSGVRSSAGTYVGNYTNQYTGQYAGDTLIDTSSETVETFTLYVRVS